MTNVQDTIEPYVDKPDAPNYDIPVGTDDIDYGVIDQSAMVAILQQMASDLRKAVEAERVWFATSGAATTARVTTNLSGEVLFSRYAVSTVPAMQVVREKNERGDIVFTNFSGGNIYIGKHQGIMAGGTDTVRIAPNSSRTIRTRSALWAIADAANCEMDVQEEFD